MKAMFLILFAVSVVEAQSLADIARQERERQSRVQSTRVITTEDVKSASSAPPAESQPAPVAEQAPAPAAKPPVDPEAEYNKEVAEIRARIRELMDQETATQLQINDATNRVFAPVTDQAARNQAQTDLAAAQKRLEEIRAELGPTRAKLAQMEAAGPPK